MSILPLIAGLVPPQWGVPLSENDYVTLAASWITVEVADAAMLRRVDSIEGNEIVGQKGSRNCAGMLIPYYWPGQPSPFNYRLRRDNPEWTQGKDGKSKPERKYLGPPNGGNRLYIPPGVTLEQLNDVQIPIALVEGEKKALALWRLVHHDTDRLRYVPMAIAGVWNWRGRTGKTGGPKGERLEIKGPIPDLNRISWGGRTAFVIFDADVSTNESVNWARKGLSRELTSRAAQVKFVNLPQDCQANGVDELLVAWGPARILELFDAAVSGGSLHVVLPPQFQSKPEGLFRVAIQGDRQSQTQLTNFRAEIVKNVQLDDGVETNREFEIDAEILGRKSRFIIPASDFAQMNWPIERLGAAAIVFPNQRGYAQTAIQSLSLTAAEKCIYTHTGWRNAGGRWIYLHGGGAVDGSGTVSDVSVRLLGSVSRYELRAGGNPSDLRSAVAASLRLIDLGPSSVSFPLNAAIWRAVFGVPDFALHLAGETGAYKSELAALHQQHFGPAMNRLNLPGAWSSTGNAIEAMAFHAKDALFVVDDFAPQGGATDIGRLNASAERVFRAAGNHAGRSRLDSTAKLREPKPPRALILSTGEEIPRGQSIRARLLILEVSKGDIESHYLAECQRHAHQGLYAQAMGGFVQWFAGRYDEVQAAFAAKTSEYRSKALASTAHARTPDIVANLQGAFELYLEFGMASDAITAAECRVLATRCWDALRDVAVAQARHQGETEPTARFLTLVRSVLSCGRAHLENRRGGEPSQSPRSCGWRIGNSGELQPQGDCIGWLEDDDIYLEPASAFRAAQMAARDSGDIFGITEQTLKKRLRERGLLASVDQKHETLTIRRTLSGSSKNVLHLRRHTLLPEAPEDAPEEIG